MTNEETKLWQKIDAFELDDPKAGFTFSKRLARENGWSLTYIHRVIAEYKRFIFLCCITESGVTPSDPVDQAWHLHLTFTRSYWIDLCQNTLGKQIHHNPTKGGQQEAKKFDEFYTSSQSLYSEKFGSLPPADIWQNNHERFADINFQRVNLSRFWLIKKPKLSVYQIVLTFVLLSAGLFIQATEDQISAVSITLIAVVACVIIYKWESDPNRDKKKDSGNGCGSSGGCSFGCSTSHDGGHHSGDSGCSSGCSGCSGSGCSGCGGGCGGD